jgi:hypothetical protein
LSALDLLVPVQFDKKEADEFADEMKLEYFKHPGCGIHSFEGFKRNLGELVTHNHIARHLH